MKTFPTKWGEIKALYQPRGLPLVICLHGLQGSKEIFSKLISDSVFLNFDVLVPDLPGFGESAKPGDFDYSIVAFAEAIRELLSQVKRKKAIVIGHSLGGMIATELLKTPIVSALISLEGNLTFDDCETSREISDLSEHEFGTSYLTQLKKNLETSSEPNAVSRLEALRKASDIALYCSACQIVSASRGGELLQLFQQAKVPKLLLVGERSSFSSHALLNSQDVKIVPGAGHFLLQDNHQSVVSVVGQFISQMTSANQ